MFDSGQLQKISMVIFNCCIFAKNFTPKFTPKILWKPTFANIDTSKYPLFSIHNNKWKMPSTETELWNSIKKFCSNPYLAYLHELVTYWYWCCISWIKCKRQGTSYFPTLFPKCCTNNLVYWSKTKYSNKAAMYQIISNRIES